MLRAGLVRELQEIIESQGSFLANDFAIEEIPSKDKKPRLSVMYRFGSVPYRFVIELPSERDEKKSSSSYSSNKYTFSCWMSPGTMANTETRSLDDKDGFIRAFREWLIIINEELRAAPLNRELEEQRQQIDAILKDLGNIPDGYLSKADAAMMAERLTDLELKLAEQLRAQNESEERLEVRIKDLHRDMEELKIQLHSLPKRGWVGSFIVRVRRWVGDPENKKLVQSGLEIAKILLPSADK